MPTILMRRTERLGISEHELARRTGLSRGAVRRALAGESVRGATLGAIEAFLDRMEHETGTDLPSLQEMVSVITLPDGTIVKFHGSAEGVVEAATSFLAKHRM